MGATFRALRGYTSTHTQDRRVRVLERHFYPAPGSLETPCTKEDPDDRRRARTIAGRSGRDQDQLPVLIKVGRAGACCIWAMGCEDGRAYVASRLRLGDAVRRRGRYGAVAPVRPFRAMDAVGSCPQIPRPIRVVH